jgi:hypothetical protein
MADRNRTGELVELCEEAEALANELGLGFIAFLAGMVVLEARQADYFSQGDGPAERRPGDIGKLRAAGAHTGRRNGARSQSPDQAANVTPLARYREATYRLASRVQGRTERDS